MRPWLTLALGVFIGQWLAFSGFDSPATLHRHALHAWERQEYGDAARMWSQAAAVQPDNPMFHYLRANALARLGHSRSAADAYQVSLLLGPPEPLAQLVRAGLASLDRRAADGTSSEATLVLEPVRGVWVTRALLNGGHQARLLVDTGASLTVISPAVAEAAGIRAGPDGTIIELETLTGMAAGRTATIPSLRLGAIEIRDVPVVIYEPGLGVDGILGNSVLARFSFTLDADQRLLHLRPFTTY